MSIEKELTQIRTSQEQIRVNQEGHNKADDRRFGEQGADIKETKEDIKEVKIDIKIIRENHLAHIQESIATLTSDVGWIKNAFEKNGYVKKSEFSLVRKLVFSAVALVLIGFAGIVGQVIIKVLSL